MATAKKDDLGQAEVQEKRNEDKERGYRGFTPGVIPDSEYSLKSGPGSPSPLDAAVAGSEQRAKDIRNTRREG